MRKFIYSFLFLLAANVTFAQQKIITGTVTGKTDKSPLAGVSVQSKSKTALTDVTGNFSFVGMKPISIKISGGDQSLTVEMEEGVKEGEQIIVVGYTSQRKQDLTG